MHLCYIHKQKDMTPTMESSTPELTGSCLCRSVTYSLDGPQFKTVLCHCENCSKASGSAFQYNALFSRPLFHLQSGSHMIRTYRDGATDSGNILERSFCSACGSQLFTTNSAAPDVIIVTAGSIDRKKFDQVPDAEFYGKRRLGWMPEVVKESS